MVELRGGGGPFLPFGWSGAFAALPFAVWLHLAIEEAGTVIGLSALLAIWFSRGPEEGSALWTFGPQLSRGALCNSRHI